MLSSLNYNYFKIYSKNTKKRPSFLSRVLIRFWSAGLRMLRPKNLLCFVLLKFVFIICIIMPQDSQKIVIVGGGAAGFFAALTCAQHYPQHEIRILEKTSKLLSKVKISGGGRCNVTHACYEVSALAKYYPRGAKFLKKAFSHFMPQDMVQWLAERGVETKVEADGRIFPVSDDSQTVIDCFLAESRRLGIEIQLKSPVEKIVPRAQGGFSLKVKGQNDLEADRVLIATGGSPQMRGWQWLEELGVSVAPPVPSLFTFNMPQENIQSLMGLSHEAVAIKILGTKLRQQGPLLITHWGMSGPAVLKTSAWGARQLHAMNYQFEVMINWRGEQHEEQTRETLFRYKAEAKTKIKNQHFGLPKRLWHFLLEKAQVNADKIAPELSKTDINRIAAVLCQDVYTVTGKTTFKEEFVTSGGVSLQEVDFQTMQSRQFPGLYLAGEVLDIDGVTGGFNFQAAWTTAYLAGLAMGK